MPYKDLDEILNENKINTIYNNITTHKFVLHGNPITMLTNAKHVVTVSKSAARIINLIQAFCSWDDTNKKYILNKNINNQINDGSELIEKIINELKNKTHSTLGFFGLGSRDDSTATLYADILRICGERIISEPLKNLDVGLPL